MNGFAWFMYILQILYMESFHYEEMTDFTRFFWGGFRVSCFRMENYFRVFGGRCLGCRRIIFWVFRGVF